MTKELLEQYPDICTEILELEEQKRRGVSDTVSSSSTEYPYTQHTVTIKGVPLDLQARLDRLKKQKAECEAFVVGLPNSRKRRIVTYRALKGYSWAGVAAKMGHHYSENSVKHIYYRAVKEK